MRWTSDENWAESKKALVGAEIIKIEPDIVNNQVKSIRIETSKGPIRIETDYGYTIHARIPAPPKTEKRYLLHGTKGPIVVDQTFEDRADAETKFGEYATETGSSTWLTIDEVEVEVGIDE